MRGSLVLMSHAEDMYSTTQDMGESASPSAVLVGEVITIVSAYKGITISPPQLSIDIFFAFLEGNVHVPIHRLEFSCPANEFVARAYTRKISCLCIRLRSST